MEELGYGLKGQSPAHFVRKHQWDDSGIGPSTFMDTKSTNFSEVSYYLHISVCNHSCMFFSSSVLGSTGQKT